jgi:hypothetical protein
MLNYEQLSNVAHLIANHVHTSCPGINCKECEKYGGWCTLSEMAESLLNSGCIVNKNDNCVEAVAKTIAVNRGYGCKPTDSCAKCSCCRTVGCVPYNIAEMLIENGFGKVGGR